MAYSTSNQPFLIAGGMGAAPRLWMYSSADAAATVDGSGYFTDGYRLGMRAGDLVLVYNSTGTIWTAHRIHSASASAVDLADGTTIGSATNTD